MRVATSGYWTTVFPSDEDSVGGWTTKILPFMEQGNVQQLIKGHTTSSTLASAVGTYRQQIIPAFQCPSDPNSGKTLPNSGNPVATTNYLGVTGNDDWNDSGYWGTNARNGMFAVKTYYQTRKPSIKIASVTDGTSNSLFVGERPVHVPQSWGWFYTSDYDNIMSSPVNDNSYAPSSCPRPSYFRADTVNSNCAWTHYWSMHTGGGNWLLGDGSVRFMTYTSAQTTLFDMASISGGEVVRE